MLITLLAAVLVAAHRPDVPDQIPLGATHKAPVSSDTSAELARLAKQTKELKSFKLIYGLVNSEGKERTLRIAYRAPDHAKFEMQSGEQSTITWILGSRVVVHDNSRGERLVADVSYAALFASGAAFDEVMLREFNVRHAPDDEIGAGPVFRFELLPESPDGKPMRFGFDLGEHRTHFLSWYLQPEAWKDARDEGDHLVREVTDIGRIVLSKQSGFIEEMRYGERSRCRLLGLFPSADDSEFIVPIAAGHDISPGSSRQPGITMVATRRALIYQSAMKFMNETPDDAELLDVKATRAFEVHTSALMQFVREGLESNAKIDEFVEWYTRRHKATVGDPAGREQIVNAAAEMRGRLDAVNAESIERYVEHVVSPTEMTSTELGAHLLRLEREAARTVFERDFAGVQRAQLDEGIRSAGGD